MAWISVHEQVIGGKLRNLAKEICCSQNEALGILIRLWLWGINNADKEGWIIGAKKEDVAEILTVGLDKRLSSYKVVEALVNTNWIDMENGLYIHDWEEWQEQWYKAIEVRQKDAARKREERKRKRTATPQENYQTQPVSEEEMEQLLQKLGPIIPHEEEQKKLQNIDYPEGFNQFWDAYPRKVGKGDAYKKYKARINSGWKPEELTEAAKNYANKVVRERTEKQYIKHPKTFLSDTEPFTDFLPKKVETKPVVNSSEEDDPYADWR